MSPTFKPALLLLAAATLAASSAAQAITPTPSAVAAAAAATVGGLSVITTDITPAQHSAFDAAIASYYAALADSPAVTPIAMGLIAGGLPLAVLRSIEAHPAQLVPVSGAVDLRSLATRPPLSFAPLPWYTLVSSAALAPVLALQTSAAYAAASIAASELSVSAAAAPSRTSSSSAAGAAAPSAGAPAVVAVAAGAAVGVAAMLL